MLNINKNDYDDWESLYEPKSYRNQVDMLTKIIVEMVMQTSGGYD